MLIKICCIQDETELRLAAGSGATHVGLVGSMPSGPGPIEDEAIARLAAATPLGVTSVLLTSRTKGDAIAEHAAATGVAAVQIVAHVDAGERRRVRRALPDLRILQVVHVRDEGALELARSAAEASDFVLLDSGRPAESTPELGGTGRTHDWSISARIVALLDVPVFLAGGLRPDNVRRAIAAVGPAGVDVCSGLRSGPGRLEAGSLRAFVGQSRPARPPPAGS